MIFIFLTKLALLQPLNLYDSLLAGYSPFPYHAAGVPCCSVILVQLWLHLTFQTGCIMSKHKNTSFKTTWAVCLWGQGAKGSGFVSFPVCAAGFMGEGFYLLACESPATWQRETHWRGRTTRPRCLSSWECVLFQWGSFPPISMFTVCLEAQRGGWTLTDPHQSCGVAWGFTMMIMKQTYLWIVSM